MYWMQYYVLILSFLAGVFSLKPKLCCECKFFIKDLFVANKYGKCALFSKDEGEDNSHFLVDGIVEKKNHQFCSIARRYANMCGQEGNYYEKKRCFLDNLNSDLSP